MSLVLPYFLRRIIGISIQNPIFKRPVPGILIAHREMICAPFGGAEGGVERVLTVAGMHCGTKEGAQNFRSKGR